MKNKILVFIIFFQMLFIICISYSQEGKDFISKEKVIDIIKLSSNRFRKGYNGSPIDDNQIKFYVNNDRVEFFNTFDKKFEKNGIILTQDQIFDIHNFMAI